MDLARRDFALVSQWGIGKSGSGVKLFDHLQKSKASYYSLKIMNRPISTSTKLNSFNRHGR